jgi:hypothetical protein
MEGTKMKLLIISLAFTLIFPILIYAFVDDFNDGKADGWLVAAGKWEVTNGEYHAPEQVNAAPYPLTFILDGKELSEFTMKAKVRNDKFHTTMNQSHAGFAFGMDSKNSGYVLYFRFHKGVKCVDVASLVLRYAIENCTKGFDPNADVAEGCNVFEAGDKEKWHILEAQVNTKNGTLKAWVDGNQALDLDVKLTPGKVGLWVADIGAASFDDVSIVGPGLAVKSDGNVSTTWGNIKNF